MKGLIRFVAFSVLVSPLLLANFVLAVPKHNHKPVCPDVETGKARCHLHVVTDNNTNPLTSSTPPSSAYTPAQLQTAYNLPTTVINGKTQTIAIVDAYDSPTIANDLTVYSQQFGLPACTTANGCFKKVNQNGLQGSYPNANSGWELEISLDVEIAHAICQNCKIVLVEANSNSYSDLLTAEQQAVKQGANVISNSWGGTEFGGETAYDIYFNHPGIAITFSSGDAGYGVQYPAASQYVTSVGGTTLTLNANNTRMSETAWSDAGSGCSAYEIIKPSFQKDTGCKHRTVADVSAVADPNTGVSIYLNGLWYQVGGTSLATPLIAGIYALSGNSASTSYASYPYSHTTSLYDVTSGSNGSCGTSTSATYYLCNAVKGYDGPTGLGTPNGTGGF
jgi:subtilase family serine protease